MSISLQKGQKISLSKENADLSQVLMGVGWDKVKQRRRFYISNPKSIDCDVSAILLTNGKLMDKADVINYSNPKHRSRTIEHMGDNTTSVEDDEEIVVDLAKVPAEYDRIVIVVNIYQALRRGHHLGLMENAFIRLVDANNNIEFCKFNLTDNYSDMSALILGEVYREEAGWKFNAIGEGINASDLEDITSRFS